jgi:hypothetical protein
MLRKQFLMNLCVKNLHQNFKSDHISVENFENPSHPPSSRSEENIGKVGQVFQDSRYLYYLREKEQYILTHYLNIYMGHAAAKYAHSVLNNMQKLNNFFFVEALLWLGLRTETVFVMPFCFQAKIREYCGNLTGIAIDGIRFKKLEFRRCFRQRKRC